MLNSLNGRMKKSTECYSGSAHRERGWHGVSFFDGGGGWRLSRYPDGCMPYIFKSCCIYRLYLLKWNDSKSMHMGSLDNWKRVFLYSDPFAQCWINLKNCNRDALIFHWEVLRLTSTDVCTSCLYVFCLMCIDSNWHHVSGCASPIHA